MKPGYYKLDDYPHLFAHFDEQGKHAAFINIGADELPGLNYLASDADFANQILPCGFTKHNATLDILDNEVFTPALEAIRQKHMGTVLASEQPPAPLAVLTVDLGPYKADPEKAMNCPPVLKAKEVLTQQVQRTLQSWPYGKQLDFKLNADSLEVRWIDK